MSKLFDFVMSVKSLAALIFSGLMVLYLIAGAIVPAVQKAPFDYTVPYIFVIEGIVLAFVIAILWGVLFGEHGIEKWRYLPRLLVFCLSLAVLLVLSVLVFFGWHTDWAKLWWIVVACIMAGLVLVSLAGEWYFRRTGRRYTQILRRYQGVSD